jgi:hypothetical protein
VSLLARLFDFTASTTIDPDQVDQELDQLLARINAMPSEALKPSAGRVAASGDLTLTTALVDVPSASLAITPVVASKLLVVATWDFDCTNDTPAAGVHTATGDLLLDGVSQGTVDVGFTNQGTANSEWRDAATRVYSIALTAAAHTVKMQAKKNAALTAFARSADTGFLYALIAS